MNNIFFSINLSFTHNSQDNQISKQVSEKTEKMPSTKLKSKKTQKKSNRSLSTACWAQNDDGTLSLSIGSKKPDSINSNDSEQNGSIPTSHDHNGNALAVAEIEMKKPPVFKPVTLPFQILKSTWSECGVDYKTRQQTLRRKEMTQK